MYNSCPIIIVPFKTLNFTQLRLAEMEFIGSQNVELLDEITKKNAMKFLMQQNGAYYWRVILLSFWSILLFIECSGLCLFLYTQNFNVDHDGISEWVLVLWAVKIVCDSMVVHGIRCYKYGLIAFGRIWSLMNVIISYFLIFQLWEKYDKLDSNSAQLIGIIITMIALIKMVLQWVFTPKVLTYFIHIFNMLFVFMYFCLLSRLPKLNRNINSDLLLRIINDVHSQI